MIDIYSHDSGYSHSYACDYIQPTTLSSQAKPLDPSIHPSKHQHTLPPSLSLSVHPSRIQPPLPPPTPQTRIRIPLRPHPSDINTILIRNLPIHRERRHSLLPARPQHPIRIPRHRKVRDVFLQHLSRRDVDPTTRAVVEGVRDVLAVDAGGDAELVGEGAVPKRAVEVIRVAGEDELGVEGDGALEVGRVAILTREIGRIERAEDVGGDGGLEGGEVGLEVGLEGRGGGQQWGGEEQAFERVVADHDVEGVGEGAGQEGVAWEGGGEDAVDDGAVGEGAVGLGGGDLGGVGGDDGGGGEGAGLGEGGDVEVLEEVLEGGFLDEVGGRGEEARGLGDGLREGDGLLAGEGGDLVHDGAAAGGFADDGDAGWVAAEEVDVLLHPLEGKALVVEGGVGDAAGGLEGWAGEPSEGPEAVVQRDEDDFVVASGDEASRIVAVLVAGCVAAAVDPNKHWGAAAGGGLKDCSRGIDVEKEAIFVCAGVQGS